jgi:hypothetical protein
LFLAQQRKYKNSILFNKQGDMMMKTKTRIISIVLLLAIALPAYAFGCGSGNNYRTSTGVVTKVEAQQMTQNYLASIEGARFKPGDIQLDGRTYLVNVVDEGGNAVVQLNIDMLTGNLRPVF